jgi:hypothetical protein
MVCPEGDSPQVRGRLTAYSRRCRSTLGRVEFAIPASHLSLPIAETSGAIWILVGLER